jgi:hypothetical protein
MGSFAQEGREYISFSTAVFDVVQEDKTSFEGRIEYHGREFYSFLKPLTGVMANTDGAIYLFTGVLTDIPITGFFYISPSFAPGIYFNQYSKDLHFLLEFRSQIELAFKFDSDIKVGLSFNHISNAGLGNKNPGVESVAITYYFPL